MATSLYDFTVRSIEGAEVPLAHFRGNVALVVNTASKCGFTRQYSDLQHLFERYRDRGFIVFGFPSNDYLRQEPGTPEEIARFCSMNFGVTFPLFAKGSVRGAKKQPVYKFLTEESNRKFQGDPGWNFVKFLVDRDGRVVNRFSAITKPLSRKIVQALEEQLALTPRI
jgi:glutathione peroxidase